MNSDIKKRIEQVNSGQVPEGYKKEHGFIAPKDWDIPTLNKIVKPASRPVNKPDKGYWRLGLRSHAKGTFHTFVEKPETVAMDELYEVKENDLVLNITFAWEHAIAVANKDDEGKLVSHRFPTYEFKPDSVASFYKAIIVQPRLKEMLANISPGGAGRNRVLNKTDFLKLNLPKPPQTEQQNIAEILSTCDRVIELKENLLTEKQNQKKWLMQRLLTGEIRLKGFSEPIKKIMNKQDDNAYLIDEIKTYNYPNDWQKKEMGKLFNFDGGLSASREALSNNGICYIHYGDIHTSSKTYIDVSKEKELLPKIDLNVDSLADKYFLNDGDMVFVDASEDYEGGSKYIVIKKSDNTPIVAGLHTIIVRSKNSMLDNNFKQFCFQNPLIKRQIAFYVTGTSVFGLSKSNLAKVVIPIPPIKEQKAIAEILCSGDKEIVLLQQEIDEYKQLKKTLMQLLLTGLVRVNELKINTRPQEKQEAQAC